jgi:hypothetical protein
MVCWLVALLIIYSCIRSISIHVLAIYFVQAKHVAALFFTDIKEIESVENNGLIIERYKRLHI